MSPRAAGRRHRRTGANEVIWNQVVSGHSNEMDQKARVWNTTSTRTPNETPRIARRDRTTRRRKRFRSPAGRGRQYTVYDPKTKKIEIVDTCFSTFHLNFAADANNTIWSGGGGLAGWVNTKVLDETHDRGQGAGLDASSSSTRTATASAMRSSAEQDPVDPTKDKKIGGSFYAVMTSPLDGSVWGSVLGSPGAVIRVAPGIEPAGNGAGGDLQRARPTRASPRAAPTWTRTAWRGRCSAAVSSRASIGASARGRSTGPNAASGNACPEGWTFYTVPGPNFKGDVVTAAADSNYYNWSDKFNSLGLGENVQIATSNLGGALLALVDGKWVVLRVPYPLGFYAKSINGRIDDPKAGWKGRGLWTGWSNRNPWHNEGGKGKSSMAVHFQVRPDPLAK